MLLAAIRREKQLSTASRSCAKRGARFYFVPSEQTRIPCQFFLRLGRGRRRRRRWGRRRCSRSGFVYQILQLFAGLEEGNLLGRNFDALTCLRIASYARTPLARTEAAKAADLDLVACAQRAYYAVENCFHNHFAVFARKFCQTRDFIDQIGFRHSAPLVPQISNANASEACLMGK